MPVKIMEESIQKRAKFARFRKNKDGVFSIEMAILIAPLMLTALFVFDIARAYIVGSSVDAATTRIMSKARLGELADVKRDTFCDDFGIAFCDIEKLGLTVTTMNLFTSVDPQPGEFSITAPAGNWPVVIKLQVSIDPLLRIGRSEEAFKFKSGGFTHAN